jgi:four helix bundle protein
LRDYRKLKVHLLAHDLVLKIYEVTADVDAGERFGLVSQLRRAAASIPLNLAEGAGRASSQVFAHHVDIAIGSSSEVEYGLTLCRDLGLIESSTVALRLDEVAHVRALLLRLRRSLLDMRRP